MAEFRLERFKYTWKGDWTSGVAYQRDDVVRVNGKSYVCVIGHVASGVFRTDLNAILPGSVPPQPQPKWTVMTSGTSFVGDWSAGQAYNLGDIAKVKGNLWLCTVSHTSSAISNDSENWTLFSTTNSVEEWSAVTSYAPAEIVKYNGNLYKCITAHISGSNLENNLADWQLYFEGMNWLGEFQTSFEYRVNDFVKFGGTVYRCIETHVSENTLDNSKFTVETFGSEYEGNWNTLTNYNIGDIVRHEGFVYYAINNNINSKPYTDVGSQDWILLSRSINFVGPWSVTGLYKTGDVVLRGGNLYMALRDIGGVYDELGNFISGEQGFDGSSLDYLDNEVWELIVPGKSYKGNWTQGSVYSVGSVVTFKGSAYTCNIEHQSDFTNFPGDNGSGFEYWDILIEAGQTAALNQKGDLLTFGPNRLIDSAGNLFEDGSTVFDDSSLGDARLPIGETEQLLSVSSELEVFWRNVTNDADSVFVASNGIDAENRGTFENPFRTIRYAAEYVEDNYEPLQPVIIRVSTGKFEEVSPIIVPAGCSVNGDELRSTRIFANSPKPEYDGLYPYVIDYLDHFTSIILNVITGIPVVPQDGNLVPQVTENFIDSVDQDGQVILDINGNAVQINTFSTPDLTGANRVLDLFNDYKNYIEFNVLSGSINPTMIGSNEITERLNILDTGEAIHLNRDFLANECLNYLKNEYPNITFNEELIINEVKHLIRAIRKDTKYSGEASGETGGDLQGNYSTLLSAQKFANSVLGSQTSNLFYMRDTTGLRDCTTGGLEGVLNPPGVFELYQKPTGGALVSLDPGWGPEDDRTWIKNRSPYIQGVTNTGTGCVGMKVDGALHAGGNKSMTANDFTQVLSDGIGAWITNNARAELVSVFTYYCQAGYFAEDGGIIRAANGNNSYGKYGSIADGIDDTEIPQVVAAFNRNNEAVVAEAFAGGANDQIKIFEYANAGQNYTAADASIVGAGADADIEYTDFRNGGIFETRLISPDGSSTAGGAGYLRRQGSAQETADASSTLKLASTDTTQFESEVLGMRVIITAGIGVGQYGYITGFNFATKEISVAKDSDDQAGWDHIVPGTPLVSAFDLTTNYRIEPRITVPAPNFTSAASILFTNRTYVDMDFGTITETYTGVSSGGNVIWRDDVPKRVLVNSIISDTSIQFDAFFASNPQVPFIIQGRTSNAEVTVTAISANTGTIIEVDVESGANGFTIGEELDLILEAGTGDTFDGAAIVASFDITRFGTTYDITLTNGGSGYSVDDKITVLGTQLGGETPANDLTITVTEVSDDSTSSILAFTSAGTGRGGRFVSLTSIENARYSDNGTDWTEVALPFNANMTSLVAGNDKFIATASGESRVASSLNGIAWSEGALPLEASWQDSVYGNGKFVLIADDTDVVASSADGVTWATGSIPNDTVGDSTISQWKKITYGKGVYLAISGNDRATATSTDGVTWTRHDQALPASVDSPFTVLSYGNNRFVAVFSNNTAYSFDGITWIEGNSIGLDDSVYDMKYSQGIFLAIAAGESGSSQCATSEDGINWTVRSMPGTKYWNALTYGNGSWYVKASAATTDALANVITGARAKFRAVVDVGSISEIRTIDPGSGYNIDNPPAATIIDPNATFDIATEVRIADGVLPQPDFINRGAGYRNASSTITITGNGFADIIPVENTLTISGVTTLPGPGVQITIEGIEDPLALVPGTLFNFAGVTVEDLGDDGTGNETNLVRFQISPRLNVEYVVNHGAEVTLRERFSQCRISGHDFLDIGTGNFEETNYPTIYSGGAFFTAAPENEVYEANSGRVYYVSTDQDGNFRTGELFSVQQATGIVTISAEFFDLDGLSELALGGVRLGGSGAVVNEFSTDSTFAADSNNVVPTQRAIATFLSDRLSVGGESLEVNKLQAGRVLVGGVPENELNTSTGQYILIPSDVVFDGTFETNDGAGNITTEQTNVSGTIVSQMMFLNSIDDSMQ